MVYDVVYDVVYEVLRDVLNDVLNDVDHPAPVEKEVVVLNDVAVALLVPREVP